ncbi:MAG TPA: oligosaccharide flippase family protein [Patescibacteria group bacterium]|nr:oligosaccharide flippase family protein [Patescibacteria group bacterium]
MNALRHMRHSQFLRDNAVFFSGSVAVGALNYLYYPILGRLLSPGAFGEVQTLVSLFLQLGIFLVVFSLVVVNIVTNYADAAARNLFVFEFEKLALVVALLLLVLSVVFRSRLQSFLHFTSSWPFMLLGGAVVAAVPFTLRSAYLRGRQRFGLVSAGNIIVAAGKLAFSVALVLAGLGTVGAIGGVVAAQVVAWGFVAWWAYKWGLKQAGGKRWLALPDMRILLPELRYGAIVLVASLALTLQYSVDILFVKHYFSPGTAGAYAGIAAAARIVFFLTASIGQVLMAAIRLKHSPEQNRQLLKKSLLLLGGIGLPVLAVLVATPRLVIRALMGEHYLAYATLLPRLSIAIAIVAVLNLLVAYYLALRRYGVAVATVLGLGASCAMIVLHHGSPAAVVDGLLFGSLAMLALFGGWKVIERRYTG